MIDLHSSENHILFNPRMPEILQKEMLKNIHAVDSLKSHVFLATSGSGGSLKWVALSKSALLISAEAVNTHLHSDHRDIWLNPLPDFHVGGLGITVRGFVNNASVVHCHFLNSKWCPLHFLKMLKDSKATLTSVVPAQVFDLVSLNLTAPSALRAVVVGGGALSKKIYAKALGLGWRLLPSYGLTECASQVATAQYGDWDLDSFPLLKPLPHVELSFNELGYLKIKSASLLSGYLDSTHFYDPKIAGYFVTEDKALFDGNFIQSISRGENFFKIGGENVDFLRLEKILEEEKLTLNLDEDCALFAFEEERLGYQIHLAVTTKMHDKIDLLVKRYHDRVFPFERIRQIHFVREIPRTSLKKILKSELLKFIRNQIEPQLAP